MEICPSIKLYMKDFYMKKARPLKIPMVVNRDYSWTQEDNKEISNLEVLDLNAISALIYLVCIALEIIFYDNLLARAPT